MASNTAGRKLFVDLHKGQLAPIYVIYGSETFLREEAIRAVGRAALPAQDDPFAHQVFEGSEVTGQTVREALENLSLFGGKRLIHVRHISAMAAQEHEALASYLDRPAAETVLLLTDTDLDARKKFFKALKKTKNAVMVSFRSLYQNELSDWVQRRGHKHKVEVDRQAASLIVDLVGPDLAPMDSALTKLALFRSDGPNRRVDVALVEQVLDDVRTHTVFELLDHLAQRDLDQSVRMVHRMLERKMSAVYIVSMVARHFRTMWRIQEGQRSGLGDGELARFAGCPPFAIKNYRRQLRHFNDDDLVSVIAQVADTDMRLKSSRLPDGVHLDRLMLGICL